MIRGISAAASGMLAAQTQSEVVADNINNLRTPAYKEKTAAVQSFPAMLLAKMDIQSPESGAQLIGQGGAGVGVANVIRNTIGGLLDVTDQPADLALVSPQPGTNSLESFFVVETPEGERYTRYGHFRLDQAGTLRTAEGFRVMGLNGEINNLGSEFRVNRDGTITGTDSATGRGLLLGQLRIVQGPQELFTKEDQFYYSAVQRPTEASGVEVVQGALENSNVDLARQMETMIMIMRAYEANQKVIQTEDSALEKAVNEVGKV